MLAYFYNSDISLILVQVFIDLWDISSLGINSWICQVYYSSFLVLAFSNVWLFVIIYIEISHWITDHINKRSQHWREGNYCHALYSTLHSVKMGECVGCHLVVKVLSTISVLEQCPLYLSDLLCYIHYCLLEADTTIAAPSFVGGVYGSIGMLHFLYLNESLCLLSICSSCSWLPPLWA